MIECILSADEGGQKIEKWLKKRFPHTPLSTLFKVLRKKKIRVNQKVAKEDLMLNAGDLVCIYENEEVFSASESGPTDGQNTKRSLAPLDKWVSEYIQVLFEDQDLLVLNKPSGIASQPGSGIPEGKSLIELVWHYTQTPAHAPFKPALAHRLDQETSGVIVACKSAAALRTMNAEIRDKAHTHKEYRALVKGILSEKNGTIQANLSRKDAAVGAKNQVSEKDGLVAITHYQVLQEFKTEHPQEAMSLLKVVLETGRMHQIRSHLSHIGHPLAGDDRYGLYTWNHELKKKYGLKRLFLHAYEFSVHDAHYVAPLAKELDEVLRLIESN